MNAIRGAVAVALCAATSCAQLSQAQLVGPSRFPAYYDAARDVLVCWDVAPSALVAGMWEFNGSSWAQFPAPNAGFARFQESVAFDQARNRFVALDQLSGMTWEWDGTNWNAVVLAPVNPRAPSLPNNFQLAYHESRQRVMLFTGSLYEWDGVSWSLILTFNAPPTWITPTVPYTYGPMAYDPQLDKLVLLGGWIGTTANAPTTYEWDPVNGWVQFASNVYGYYSGTMWFDRHRGCMLQGRSTSNPVSHAVYYRDSARQWTLLQNTTAFLQAGCYDGRNNRFLSVGYPSIDVLQDTFPAEFGVHAQGCQPPVLADIALSEPWSRAWLGGTLGVDVTSPTSIAFLAMGFSDQAWQGTPLPLDLTALGLTGCRLNVAAQASVLAGGVGGHVNFGVVVPVAQSLLGLSFYQQAFAFAPSSNPAGIVATDSVHCTVGLRQ